MVNNKTLKISDASTKNQTIEKPHSSQKFAIQVGAFSKKNAADNYLNELVKRYDKFAKGQPMLTTVKRGEDYIYRAKFTGLSFVDAREACLLLKKMGRYCMMSDVSS